MSGGSFNYLYAKDASDLLAYEGRDDLRRMVETLEGLGADDAAAEADSILKYLEIAERRADARLKRLCNVFQAVEWWRSCDSSEESARQAIDKWRGEGT